jgi:hypothetical protein
MKLRSFKLKGEKRIMAILFTAMYLGFWCIKYAMFPEQTLLWHAVTGLIGLVFVILFTVIVVLVDSTLDKRFPYETNALKRVIIQFVITLSALLAVRFIVGGWVVKWFKVTLTPELLAASIAINIYFVLSVVLSLFSYRFFTRWKQETIVAAELEKEKVLVQYDNLKNQLNPHFLFNSLTSLNSLIFENPQLASEFLQQLSKVYRYVLENKEKNLVAVDTEISFVEHYVKLLKARFENGLEVTFSVDETTRQKAIVPVTLQILIENAIKHNVTQKTMPLHISIFSNGSYLVVENNLQKKKVIDASNGQGLDNLKKLYEYLTPSQMIIGQTEKLFTVSIPLVEL